ncbi:hypothetical protein GTY44_10745 [Streptomyces sp. SID5914]|nr:hypothetical protein [Streptomyces sp. SID5914]MZG13965.1 hypothetical protein [Streptomyces sp. SID5914]
MHTDTDEFRPRVHFDGPDGRIVVGNSLTSFEKGSWSDDVVLGASFAGVPTGVLPVRQGAKGWIAHEGGPGKDEAGIGGLPVAERFGVPAAAIATMTARLGDGDSLLTGTVSRVNAVAADLGVKPGMTGEQAAHVMLKAPRGRAHDVSGLVDERTLLIRSTPQGSIYSCWSTSRVEGEHPDDVFCVASHGAKTMAAYAVRINPKGLICNDAGMGLGDSGIEGLPMLEEHGIGAAAVSSDSARIGDPASTLQGTVSAVNRVAAERGVQVGMAAAQAADLLLGN